MNKKETVSYCIDSLKKAGADKAACSLNITEKKELNVEIGEMTLLRTTFNSNIGISVIKDQKKGSTSINKTDKSSKEEGLGNCRSCKTTINANDIKHEKNQPPEIAEAIRPFFLSLLK